jgi:hypothetical protein
MIEPERSDDTPTARYDRNRLVLAALIAPLLAAGVAFRLMHLSSMPGVSGDEGWWGIQALAWLSNRPYEARTTSGNPTDLFFLIPVALVQTIAPPSFLLLRLVPALVNLLALPVGFWLVRRVYGSTTAWIYTVVLAILPTAIAHSRICQDPSQSIFWTAIVVCLSLLGLEERGRAWIYSALALLVFPVALWTHPTNIFIAPFVVLAVVDATRSWLPASLRMRRMLFLAAALLLVLGVVVAGSVFSRLPMWSESLDKPWLQVAVSRMTDGAQLFEFAANNARLFNGVTVYHYFSGARPATFPYDAGFVLLAIFVLCGLLLTRAAGLRRVDAGLLLACAGMWIGFYLFAGPQALRPHAERWGLCLIVPATLVVARGLTGWMEWTHKARQVTIAVTVLGAMLVLASFYVNYFREFASTGGRSHLTYITAATEPKQQALERILARSGGPNRIAIVTQQWWLFWPISYLATAHPNVTVGMSLPLDRQPDLPDAMRDGRLFFVEFVGTPELTATIEWIRERGLRSTTITVADASGRDLLAVLQIAPER